MKLETVKRSNKKKIIIGSMIVLSVTGCLTLTTTRAKYRNIQNIKLANGTIDYKAPDLKLAIKISEDGTTYKNSSTIPEGNYTFNEEKSKCRIPTSILVGEEAPVAEGVSIEYTDGKINVLGVTKKNTRCYIYFDKILGQTSETIIADIKARTDGSYKGNTTPTFTSVATGAEADTNNGIFETDDPMYGSNAKTYYWRGAATTNHVIFDNKCWRIVRINGDKSIRLIYNGTPTENICPSNGTNTDSVILKGTQYHSSAANSSYAGWSNVYNQQRPSDTDTTIGSSASIRSKLEKWYRDTIIDKSKIATGKYCNDRNTKDNEIWIGAGGTQQYAAYTRILESATQKPSLSCHQGDIYNVEVGLVSADEVQFAGASGGTDNTSYYLYNGQNYWTMTPGDLVNTGARVFYVSDNGGFNGAGVWWLINNNNVDVRPIINLRSDVTFNLGSDGTENNPYIVQ